MSIRRVRLLLCFQDIHEIAADFGVDAHGFPRCRIAGKIQNLKRFGNFRAADISSRVSAWPVCPLYPRKRTLPGDSRMSALCQKQTFRPLWNIIGDGPEGA
jgi:hypothetical protein